MIKKIIVHFVIEVIERLVERIIINKKIMMKAILKYKNNVEDGVKLHDVRQLIRKLNFDHATAGGVKEICLLELDKHDKPLIDKACKYFNVEYFDTPKFDDQFSVIIGEYDYRELDDLVEKVKASS